jgi:hypothetical protein
MARLTLISLGAIFVAVFTSPGFAAGSGIGEHESLVAPCPGSGMGARDRPASQMGEMGPHHHAHSRHYAGHHYHHRSTRWAGIPSDHVARQLNSQEYASHMQPGAAPQSYGYNAFPQGYTTAPLSTPEVNRMPVTGPTSTYPSGYGYTTPAVSLPEVNRR